MTILPSQPVPHPSVFAPASLYIHIQYTAFISHRLPHLASSRVRPSHLLSPPPCIHVHICFSPSKSLLHYSQLSHPHFWLCLSAISYSCLSLFGFRQQKARNCLMALHPSPFSSRFSFYPCCPILKPQILLSLASFPSQRLIHSRMALFPPRPCDNIKIQNGQLNPSSISDLIVMVLPAVPGRPLPPHQPSAFMTLNGQATIFPSIQKILLITHLE